MASLMRLPSLCIRKYRAGGPALIKRCADRTDGFISALGIVCQLISFQAYMSTYFVRYLLVFRRMILLSIQGVWLDETKYINTVGVWYE